MKKINQIFKSVLILFLLLKQDVLCIDEQLWRQMNVKYQMLNEENLSEPNLFYLKKLIIPELQNRIRKIILLKGSSIIGGYNENCNEKLQIPLQYKQSFIGDLVIFIGFLHDDFKPNYIAKICNIDQDNQRPNIGWITVNLLKISLNYKNSEVLINQLLHQTFHILGFSQNVINYFPYIVDLNQQKKIQKEDQTLEINTLQTPILVKSAMQHFDCDNIQGVFLENQKEYQGIHFERIFFGDELMTLNDQVVSKISKLSLGFLEDSGWYKVNYSEVQDLKWGKHKGCKFLNEPCDIKFDEFCSVENQVQCSTDFKSKVICKRSNLTENCFYKESQYQLSCNNSNTFQFTALQESPGGNSRCFNIKKSEQTAGCFKSFCYNNKIIIKIEDQEYSCTQDNSEITLQNQTIICPDIKQFCQEFDQRCYQDCNGNGECLLNKQCRCYLGYYGQSCEFQEDCQNSINRYCEYIQMITPEKQQSNLQKLSIFIFLILIKF